MPHTHKKTFFNGSTTKVVNLSPNFARAYWLVFATLQTLPYIQRLFFLRGKNLFARLEIAELQY